MSASEKDQDNNPDVILDKLLRKARAKESRWDRIRRKHLNNLTVTSKTVKKFINMDFVDESQLRLLMAGESAGGGAKPMLDPVLVMDIRHEMIRRKEDRVCNGDARPKTSIDPVKAYQQENLENHNRSIELTLCENELNKFRKQLEQLGGAGHGKKTQVSSQKRSILYINIPKIDNGMIYESLEECERYTTHFYQSAIEGTEQLFEEGQDEPLGLLKETATIEEIVDREELEVEPVEVPEMNPPTVGPVLEHHLNGNHHEPEADVAEQDEDSKIVRFGNTEVITFPADDESSFSLGSEYDFEDNDLFLESLDSDVDEFDETEFQSTDSTADHSGVNGEERDNKRDSLPTDSSECLTISRLDTSHSGSKEEDTSSGFSRQKLVYNYDDDESELLEIAPSAEKLSKMDPIMVRKCDLKDYSELCVTNYKPDPDSKDDRVELTEESRKVISNALKEGYLQNHDRAILKQYFFKWLQYTILEKISKGAGVTSTREQKLKRINDFISNIRHSRKKGSLRAGKPATEAGQPASVKKEYEHRLKVQQDIIELQKLKLERQERIITELKLSKFSEASKISKAEIQSELLKAARTGHVRLRAKAKCIQIVGNIKPDTSEEDEMRKLQAQGLMIPKFLAKMQQRALERSQRHQEAKERRMKLEKEREDAKQAAEEAKRQEDEDARKRRYREMREKRKLEKLQKIIREQERQAWIANNQIAKEFRLLKLKRFGMHAFKLLLGIRHENERRSVAYRRRYYKRKYFRRWWSLTNALWESKKAMADGLHECKLYRLAVRHWQTYMHEQRCKLQVALDWYEVRMTEKVISIWIGKTKQSLMILQGKMSHAASHYEWQLKWKVFERWQRLHIILRIEKETEMRRQRWRMKIWELLPDYKPIEEDI
ncbi:probable DNA double-strand break repair Rad50 ATPase [Anopheles stephensi]|uniref:probable DNA double-strand break repair Rad50 ATPase n=1 Tax=Anopheles stephensi TaxID=30069 RepID=UPI00165898F5|nr:probable DNA double-strand break repair Rad50 ATPase [Anopheles stephensi]